VKISLILVGKTDDTFIKQAVEIYSKRLSHYIQLNVQVITEIKNSGKLAESELKEREGELVLKLIQPADFVLLLDDKGKQFTSVEYAAYLQKLMNAATKNLVVVVGGAFGFSDKVYKRANAQLSLSKMTFTHQLVRVFFLEQTYRAFTILKGESYHHD
jgi:23S rRNA (pseudouridine1915-N3)-methyltransferase